jgi:hypothetical protein
VTTKGGQSSLVRPKEPSTGDFDGQPFVVNPREIFSRDHPLVRAFPDLFEPVRASRPAVEEMTAEPGRKRGEG